MANMAENFDLSWTNFKNHTSTAFQELLEQPDFVDVTLACEEEKQISAHKIILSASSPFFKNILQRNLHQRPLIFLDGVNHRELVAIVDFIYLGKAEVRKDGIEEFLRVGRKLKISGLDVEDRANNLTNTDESNKQNNEEAASTTINPAEIKTSSENTNTSAVNESQSVTGTELLVESMDDTSNEKDLVEETVIPSMTITESDHSNNVEPAAVENVAANNPGHSKNVEPAVIEPPYEKNQKINKVGNNSKILDRATEPMEQKPSEIANMLKGDLVSGLILTKKKSETPKSEPKSKKKVKEQSHECDLCDYKAAEIGNLRMHTFYKHGGKTYPCDQCEFKAQRLTGLKFHKSMKHGRFGK